MTDIFKTTENSTANIQKYIEIIDDEYIREIFQTHWPDIVAIGRLESSSERSQSLRSAFFDAIKAVITTRMGEE